MPVGRVGNQCGRRISFSTDPSKRGAAIAVAVARPWQTMPYGNNNNPEARLHYYASGRLSITVGGYACYTAAISLNTRLNGDTLSKYQKSLTVTSVAVSHTPNKSIRYKVFFFFKDSGNADCSWSSWNVEKKKDKEKRISFVVRI